MSACGIFKKCCGVKEFQSYMVSKDYQRILVVFQKLTTEEDGNLKVINDLICFRIMW